MCQQRIPSVLRANFMGAALSLSPAHWNHLGVVQEHSDSPAILMWFVRMQSRCSGYAKFSLMIVSCILVKNRFRNHHFFFGLLQFLFVHMCESVHLYMCICALWQSEDSLGYYSSSSTHFLRERISHWPV